MEDFERAVSALFAQGSAAVNPATRCEAEQYLRGMPLAVAYGGAARGVRDSGVIPVRCVWGR